MTASEWLEANAALIPHQVAGLALLGVGIWLLGFHARAASTRHFAGFLLGYGVSIVLSSIALPDPAMVLVLNSTAAVAYFYGATAMLLCILTFPRPIVPAVEAPWATLLPAAVATAAAVGVAVSGHGRAGFAYGAGIGNVIAACANAAALVRLGREPPGTSRRSLLLLAIGLTLQGAYFWTLNVVRAASGTSPYGDLDVLVLWGNVAALLILLGGAALLLGAARGDDPERVRMARLALAMIPVGAATGVLSAQYATVPWVWNLGGIWRLLFAGLVTWGILRHQFLGVDLRVRWAIGKSSIAAAFIAVFFVASEAAQQFFGETLGSAYVGIAAAGALVFAIAPLQRAAERLAERAVPAAAPAATVPVTAPPQTRPDPEEAYRKALRLAMRDRRLTPDERVHLAEVAEAMGIGAGRAAALVREAESESEVTP